MVACPGEDGACEGWPGCCARTTAQYCGTVWPAAAAAAASLRIATEVSSGWFEYAWHSPNAATPAAPLPWPFPRASVPVGDAAADAVAEPFAANATVVD